MIKKEQYKLELYKPTGEYAGLLDVFNLNANLNIEGYSTISFNIAAYIDAEENMRLFEVLDLYEVVLTIYNKKYRFILRSIPVSFDDSGPRYTYEGISTESELDKKIIADWIGVKRDIDFYHYKFKTPGSGNYPAVPGGHTVIELSDPYPEIVNLDKVAEIIEVFEVREDDDLFRQTPLIYKDDVEYKSGEGVFFKRGTYHLQRNGSNLKIIIAKYEEKDLYGTTNAERLLSDELGIYYNIYLNPPFDFSEDGETGLLLISEAAENAIYEPMTAYSHEETYNVEYYSKMGVTIEDILLDNLYKATNGIWTFDFKGVSAAKIAEIKRGDFEFNNISIYSILEEIRNSYDVVYLVDTYERNITFYKKHEEYNPEIINSIVLGEGAYLKSIEKTLDTNEVATNIYGLGKDYISTSLFSPTVSWFDYSYYLDGAWTLADSAWKDNNGDLIPNDVLFNFINNGFNLWSISKTDEIESKWMPKDMALMVAEWQILRDIIVDIYLGKIRPSDYPLNRSTRRYKLLDAAYNMIEKREEMVEELTKLETQLISQEAEYKNYKALADFSLRQSERIGLSPEEEEEYGNRYQNFLKISEGLFDGIEEKKNRIKDMENQLFETNLTDEWENPEKDYFTYVFLAIQEEMKNHLESGIGSNGAKTLQKFTFDYLLQDDTVITTKDLLEKVKEYAAENSKPKVSLNVDIIDILAAHDIPEEDRESLFVGNYLYVNFPMFNVDEKAQIKSMSIDFDSNSVSLEISTVERYATGLLQKMVKNLRHLGTNYMNVGKYKEDETKKFKNAAKTSETIIDGNILEYKNIENEEETIVIDNHAMTLSSVDIDHNKQAIVRISREDRIEIGSGSVFLEKINTTIEDNVITDTQGVQVITSLDEGFIIKQIVGWDSEREKKILKRMFQATEGGNLYVEGTVDANEGRIGKWFIGDGLYAGGSGEQVIIKPPTQGEEGEEGDDNVILIGGSNWNESNFAVDKYGRVKLALDGGDVTDLFVFDPENENGQHLAIEGKVTAHEGAIANWIIKPNHLYNQSNINDNSTYVGLRSSEFYGEGVNDSNKYAFIAGGTDVTAPFWINYEGTLKAIKGRIGGWIIGDSGIVLRSDTGSIILNPDDTNLENEAIRVGSGNTEFVVLHNGDATVKGTIRADYGYIGDWEIIDNKLTSTGGNIILDGDESSSFAIQIKKKIEEVDTDMFTVTHEGALYVLSAFVKGEIEADKGYIGDWLLDNRRLVSTGENVILDGDESSSFAIQIKKKIEEVDTDMFTVTHEGDLYALSASVKGEIKADEGYIGNWSLLNNTLVSSGEKVVLDGNENSEYSINVNDLFTVTPSGDIKSESGEIGGWEIDSTSLSSGGVVISSSGDHALEVIYNSRETFSLSHLGYLKSISGEIGGWTIEENKLYSGDTSQGKYVGLFGGESEVAISIGNESYDHSMFGVKKDGTVRITAKGESVAIDSLLSNDHMEDGKAMLKFDGHLITTSGTIGNWNISGNGIYQASGRRRIGLIHNQEGDSNYFRGGLIVGRETYYGYLNEEETYGIFLGIGEIDSQRKEIFSIKGEGHNDSVLWDGNSLNIRGVIDAREGYIGNWTIKDGELYSQRGDSSNFVRIAPALAGESTKRVLEMSSDGVSNFYVQGDGTIFSQKGSIAGWEIVNESISRGDSRQYVGFKHNNLTSTNFMGGLLVGRTSFYEDKVEGENNIFDFTHGLYVGVGNVLDNEDDGDIWVSERREVISARGTNGHFLWNGRNLDISGTVRAKRGNVGGWIIRSNRLYKEDGNYYVGIHTPHFSYSNKWDEIIAFAAGGVDAHWNNAKFAVTYDGKIKATKGFIGGWEIGDNILSSGEGSNFVGISSDESSDYRFWAGASNPGNADFWVKKDGSLKVSNAKIGEWTVDTRRLSIGSGSDYMGIGTYGTDPDGYRIWAGASHPNSANFWIKKDGEIFSRKGTIGGWQIGEKMLSSGTGSNFVGISSDKSSDYRIWAGAVGGQDAPFSVQSDGTVIASKAEIEGKITATEGTLGGFSMDSNYLWSGTKKIGSGYSEDGITFYNGQMRSPNFYIDGSGEANFRGHLEATSGKIGPFNIGSSGLSVDGYTYDGRSRYANMTPYEVKVGLNSPDTYTSLTAAEIRMYHQSGSRTSYGSLSAFTSPTRSLYWVSAVNSDLLLSTNSDVHKIYVGNSGGNNTELFRNPNGDAFTAGHSEMSSKVVKKDIVDLDPEILDKFIEAIDIKEFTYKADDSKGISHIIEDEIEKDNPLKDYLFFREEGSAKYESYEDVPEYLREYIGTDDVVELDGGGYQFNRMNYHMGHLLNISIAVIKKQHEEIKELKNDIKEIKEHLGL